MDYVKVVAGFAVKDNAVLHCQRYPNPAVQSWSEAWCLPGGKVEPGESWEDALRREWLEEVSAEVIVGELISTFAYRQCGYGKPILVRTYMVELVSELKLTPAGGQAMEWIPLQDVPRYRCLVSTKPALDAYRALTRQGVVRS